MENKNSVSIFTTAYRLAGGTKVLSVPGIRRLFIPAYFLYKRLFEDALWSLARRRPELFKNGDILDIGANIGYTACLFARTAGASSKVYAFEPDGVTFGLLQEVIRRRGLSQSVETINMAAGARGGTLKFWHNKDHSADHRVATEQFESARGDATHISTVRVTSIDDFVKARGLQRISFIKIDVQGYELAVCEGMRETLEKFPDVCVCLEYSPGGLTELGFAPEKLLDLLRSSGHKLHVLTRSGICGVTSDDSIERFLGAAGYVDLLCSRRSLA